ncbi:ABC transporter ATP-binding protein [Geminicoccaceae bacterium 1502E]|nr:ABC transporter ATP-binding protein [Geminicoccaceae bacterium 1502E]
MSGHLLEVNDLAISFGTVGGGVQAVDGISFHLDRGETLAILGESGSGKSVSASAIMAILDCPPGRIARGSILFEGRDLLSLSESERRRLNGERIAMIFQDTLAHLNPVYSVGWQIAETLEAHKRMAAREARAKAVRLMESVGIPEPARRANDYPHQFSGGQRQRLMIAMAMALEPALLVADEPTTALDVTVQAQILDLLREARDRTGMGMLLITHDLGVVADIADRVAVMYQGRIVETGPVREVLGNPQHGYTQRLLSAVPGREPPPPRAPVADLPVFEARNLTKHFPITGGLFRRATGEVVRAVDGVSLTLHRGETLGVVGESGSGKSTLARMLLRLEEPTSGAILFEGKDVSSLGGPGLLSFRRRVQVVFQDPFASLDPRMRVAELIAEPWTIHKDVLPRPRWNARIAELLSLVGLQPEHAARYPHQFSGGQRQRIAIARALALEPEIIICDEAVSALDVSIQAQILALLDDLQRAMGLAYLFIAHDLPVVRQIADRVAVMQRGRIVEQGPCEEVFERPQHPYTRALLAASPVPDPDAQAARRKARRELAGA